LANPNKNITSLGFELPTLMGYFKKDHSAIGDQQFVINVSRAEDFFHLKKELLQIVGKYSQYTKF